MSKTMLEWFFYSNYCKFIHLFGKHNMRKHPKVNSCTWCDYWEYK